MFGSLLLRHRPDQAHPGGDAGAPGFQAVGAGGGSEGVNGRTPFDAAALGDAAAGQVIDEYVSYLGCGVASLVNIFQPEVFCIGGGPSAQGETLMAPVRYILNREDYARNQVHRTRLVRAQLGNDAGLIGAALLPKFR